MLTLLMTRPQRAAERFVAGLPTDLRSRLVPLYSPLVSVVPVSSKIEFDDARGLIFTSSNGVAIAAGLTTGRRELPCFCVGRATTLAAQQAGWQAECAGATSLAMIGALKRPRPEGPLLHIRGTHSRGNVAARLTALGFPTREQVIYDQPLLPLSEDAGRVLSDINPVIVPLFSPRTARQFANLVTGPAPLYIAALSDAVAIQVKALKYKELSISRHPNADAMAQLIGQLSNDAVRVEGTKPTQ